MIFEKMRIEPIKLYFGYRPTGTQYFTHVENSLLMFAKLVGFRLVHPFDVNPFITQVVF